MKEMIRFKPTCNRFRNSMLSSIEHFRKGQDNSGLDSFLGSLEDFETLLDHLPYCGEATEKLEKIVPAIQRLYVYIQNRDIVGITDILEFTLYPIANEWVEGCDDK